MAHEQYNGSRPRNKTLVFLLTRVTDSKTAGCLTFLYPACLLPSIPLVKFGHTMTKRSSLIGHAIEQTIACFTKIAVKSLENTAPKRYKCPVISTQPTEGRYNYRLRSLKAIGPLISVREASCQPAGHASQAIVRQ
jgi:hypothetical protein